MSIEAVASLISKNIKKNEQAEVPGLDNNNGLEKNTQDQSGNACVIFDAALYIVIYVMVTSSTLLCVLFTTMFDFYVKSGTEFSLP